jgi:DNA-binding transcriptional ArsR family regulator
MNQLDLTPLWKALAEPKRRRIIQLLHQQARTTSEISAHFDVSRFAIMRHLKVLEQAGLIRTRREGRQRWNYLNEDLFQEVQDTYLESDAEYQLGDVLSFLVREEGGQPTASSGVENRPIQLEAELPASRDSVFRALTDEIDGWWSYRIAADSTMRLESNVGGRLYESFEGGGGALYAFITYVKIGEELHLKGSMGLVEEGGDNIIHIKLRSLSADKTLLKLSHHFVGRVSVVTVDTFKRSWVELLTHYLAAFLKSGIR